ncbi:hypothetical protein Sjap_019810 [Stephania japonica]|uniref:Uncharacterized protein n=1 Tax=Stephania japonica TaxID=461633 RepID=A0AAP0HZQ1_9MAGN
MMCGLPTLMISLMEGRERKEESIDEKKKKKKKNSDRNRAELCFDQMKEMKAEPGRSGSVEPNPVRPGSGHNLKKRRENKEKWKRKFRKIGKNMRN